MEHIITPIAVINSDYKEKFGIPRQSGLADNESMIVFEPEFRNPDCLRGIERYSHLWLIWLFSEHTDRGWSPTVRPPRLGGNERLGVWATRSPFRPNNLGLSSVELVRSETHETYGPVLIVRGADLLDRTPIFDIKPYLKDGDSHPDAVGSLSRGRPDLQVICPEEYLDPVPKEKRQPLIDCLCLDPRPAYHNDPTRVYGMRYSRFNVRFRIEDMQVIVLDIQEVYDS